MDVLGIMNTPVVRRAALALALAPLAAALATATVPACAGDPASTPSSTAEPAAAADAARALVGGAQARLAFALIDKAAPGPGDDVTLSPASLASALDLVSIGADPAMKAAIAKVLGFEKSDAGLAALAGVRERLGSGGDGFTFADKLVFAPSHPPGKFLLPGLEKYHVPYEILDLSSAEGARQVDDWVKDVTHGLIPEILGAPLPKGSLAALNALHFKSRWSTPFDPKATQQAAFTGQDGKTADVAMMRLARGTRAFRHETLGEHHKEREFVAVDLPFADPRFSLVVATTAGRPAAAREFAPVADWLSGAGFAPHAGDLQLPRFSAASREDLLKTLDGLGLEKARKSPSALAAFGEGVELTQVTQRTMIDVNEEGAEAAAATAAIVETRALLGGDSIHMVVDKPFLYALRDNTTGLILVAGYVGRPPKATS